MMDTDELLKERGKTHGLYSDHAAITQATKDLWRSHTGWEKLSPSMREALEMNAHKVGRTLAGNAYFEDHWDDIAGYAKLVANELREHKQPPKGDE
jgi:hypothetical protein